MNTQLPWVYHGTPHGTHINRTQEACWRPAPPKILAEPSVRHGGLRWSGAGQVQVTGKGEAAP